MSYFHRIFSSVALCVGAYLPANAAAQIPNQSIQTEIRADGIFARTSGVEAGFGVSIPAGIYVRTGLVAGLGASTEGVEGRTDLIARFSLDPFGQSRWGPYAGAGLSGRYRPAKADGSRAYLLVFLGIEGPLRDAAKAGWVPAIEIGLGGGARVGIALRSAIGADSVVRAQ